MANEQNRTQPHELRLDDRSRLSVSGVSEIESFDDSTVVLHTARGVLVIRGGELRLKTLSIDGGQVAVSGTIDTLSYEDAPKAGGFLRRLFR